MKSLAINVAANAKDPGNRGPIFGDGSFEYVPIKEKDGVGIDEPTYEQLGLADYVPNDERNSACHFDPEFPEFDFGTKYTYGDRHSAKTGRIKDLSAGDYLFFYGTFDYWGDNPPDHEWISTDWAAYLFGHFQLSIDPITGDEFRELDDDESVVFSNNAHVRREPFDAEMLVLGDEEQSMLYETAIPLGNGIEPNRIVTEMSSDSGNGPWFRRPMAFEEGGTERLLEAVRSGDSTELIA